MSKIDDIMDTFDFARVHKAMVALDWKWAFCDGAPEEYELRKFARKLLKDACIHGSTSCGGFTAIYEPDYLSLKFILEEQYSE